MIVLQSHNPKLITPWMRFCLESVRAWAQSLDAEYRFIDDALFDPLPTVLRERYRELPVILSDLARLLQVRLMLREETEAVVWCDADVLVFAPERFALPDTNYALGREHWIQLHRGKPRCYKKLHNAVMLFRAGNSFLDFYIEVAARLLDRAKPPLVPQFIGPKLLGALDNIAALPSWDSAGMLSPLLVSELLKGPGPALQLLHEQQIEPIAAANLCASLIGASVDGVRLSESDYEAVIELLSVNGTL